MIEAWRKLAIEIGAEVVKGSVVAKSGEWTIILGTSSTSSVEGGSSTNTRMYAPYVSKGGFRFTIHRGPLTFVKPGKLVASITIWLLNLGQVREVNVGYPEFDQGFIIKGNDESKVRALFANPKIRQLIQSQPEIYFGAGPNKLYFWESGGIISDTERLKSLFELFKETLNQLRDMSLI